MTQFKQFRTGNLPTKSVKFGQENKYSGKFCSLPSPQMFFSPMAMISNSTSSNKLFMVEVRSAVVVLAFLKNDDIVAKGKRNFKYLPF